MLVAVLVCAVVPMISGAGIRAMVYSAVVSRSGAKSDCATFSSLFAADGVYESPVGSQPAVGPSAIAAACGQWNALLGPQGNGWYPTDLYNANNRTAFALHIRAVSAGECAVDLHSIVTMVYDVVADKILQWNHYYDSDFVGPNLLGTCTGPRF